MLKSLDQLFSDKKYLTSSYGNSQSLNETPDKKTDLYKLHFARFIIKMLYVYKFRDCLSLQVLNEVLERNLHSDHLMNLFKENSSEKISYWWTVLSAFKMNMHITINIFQCLSNLTKGQSGQKRNRYFSK